ncbi:MAG: hypothetical protein RLY14_1227 [Planctomycetota bacterium]|jgi:hypothetical protein
MANMANKERPAAGQAVGSSVVEQQYSAHTILTPVKVLIRQHPDGFVEVYADGRIQLYVQKVLAAPGVEGERLAIEYADVSLPISHRGLDDATKLVTTFDTRPMTVSDLVTVQASLGSLQVLSNAGRNLNHGR